MSPVSFCPVSRAAVAGRHSLGGVPDPSVPAALDRATGGLAQHEDRPAQEEMAEAVGGRSGSSATW